MRRLIRYQVVVVCIVLVVAGCSGGDNFPDPLAAVSSSTTTTSAAPVTTIAGRPPPPPPLIIGPSFEVTDFGAIADGRTDNTGAFQTAIDAAAEQGGTVVVPADGSQGGYVLNGTVSLPSGVALVVSTAGLTIDPVGPHPWPGTDLPGVKLLIRPTDNDQPAFRLAGGTTVRGFWLSYDQQPLPSDAEISAIDGEYGYRSFESARTFFVDEHVPVMAPTFFIDRGDHVTIADIIADRYYDFLYMRTGGPLRVDNATLYGYNKGFVIEDSDVRNVFTNVDFRPAVGPIVPGPDGQADTWSWVFGAVASNPDNVGFHLARSAGFVLDSASFEGVHTAVRIGASFDIPVINPETDTVFASPSGQGAWGQISNTAMRDVAVGFHLVGPSTHPIQMSNVSVALGVADGSSFEAITGTGDFDQVAAQAMMWVEPTYAAVNNGDPAQVPGILATNLSVSGSASPLRYAGAAATAADVNGRMFLVDGDLGMQIVGFSVGAPYDESTTIAGGPNAGEVVIHIRAYLASGRPESDKLVERTGVEVLTPDILIVERPVIIPPPAPAPPPLPTPTLPPPPSTTLPVEPPPTTTPGG